jgi:cytochrome c6
MKQIFSLCINFVSLFSFFPFVISKDLELGKEIFLSNCNVCHINGRNLIIPEKNLQKETLEINGMNSIDSIIYQVINGKNGMPAFGGRLKENEIEAVSNYVIQESLKNFRD